MFKIFNSLLLKLFFLSFILVAFPYSSNSIKLDEITAEEVIIKKENLFLVKIIAQQKKSKLLLQKVILKKQKV